MKKETIWSLIIGAVIGICISSFYHWLEKKETGPVFSITNTPSIIFDKNSSSPKIKLLVNDSVPVDKNVYTTTLAIWNKGKKTITKNDIRKDFFICSTDTISEILDYKILKEAEAGISNFKLSPVGNKLQIGWEFFDYKYGFEVQVIYSGVDSTDIKVVGMTEDSKVNEVLPTTKESRTFKIGFIGMVVTVIMFIISMVSDYIKRKKKFWLLIVSILGMIAMLLIFLFLWWNNIVTTGVPF